MRRFVFLLLLAALFTAAYLRWERGAGMPGHRVPEKFTPAAAPVLTPQDVPVMAALDSEYTKLVQTVVPSVVSIATARRVRVPLVDPLDFFFGRQRMAERTQTALGSGVVVSKEGHILTNHHVIADMEEIHVQLTDGRVLPAKLIGSNEAVDIAVLQVDAPNLTPLLLGDSDQVRVGQMVFAVGNPFGLQETVTRGIISAKGRALHDSGVQFLQTDAAVNPGNSGGPLLNLRGEIIGINSAIYSQTGGWAGISFAIPSNTARLTLDGLIKTGRAPRGYLGINVLNLNPALAQQRGLPDTRGALITQVAPGSPAERAGLKQGDVVRSFNGQETPDGTTFIKQIAAAAAGTSVQLGIVRDGAEQSVTAEIAELPATAMTTPQTAPRGQAVENVLAGVDVGEIPSTLRDRLPPNIEGVLVTQLQPDSPAAERLRVGDVIEEINSHPVRNPNDFATLAHALRAGERAVLYITRGTTRLFVVVTP